MPVYVRLSIVSYLFSMGYFEASAQYAAIGGAYDTHVEKPGIHFRIGFDPQSNYGLFSDLTYCLAGEHTHFYNAGINLRYCLHFGRKIVLYPMAGVDFSISQTNFPNTEPTKDLAVGANLGLGAQARVTHRLYLFAEGRYTFSEYGPTAGIVGLGFFFGNVEKRLR